MKTKTFLTLLAIGSLSTFAMADTSATGGTSQEQTAPGSGTGTSLHGGAGINPGNGLTTGQGGTGENAKGTDQAPASTSKTPNDSTGTGSSLHGGAQTNPGNGLTTGQSGTGNGNAK